MVVEGETREIDWPLLKLILWDELGGKNQEMLWEW
jgi:hypothetical protein